MRSGAATVMILVLAMPLAAAEVVGRVDWRELSAMGELPYSASLRNSGPDGALVLAVDHQTGEPLDLELAVIEGPPVSTNRWAMKGALRSSEVFGAGYLEMLSCFPSGDCFFTRTLADSGPMASLIGSSDWREVILPFISSAEAGPPSKLVLRLVLPSAGGVELTSFELVQYQDDENPMSNAAQGAWWSARTGGLAGGIGGTLLGVIGGTVGLICGLGRLRRLVVSVLWVVAAAGAPVFVAGLWALAWRQPFEVWYPLLLLGGLATALGAGLQPVVRRRYESVERQRMRAMDL